MWRVTFFFQVETYTWTESHYLPAGGSVASVTAVAVTIANARTPLMAFNAKILAVRIENLTPPRTVYYLMPGLFNPTGQYAFSYPVGAPGDNDSAPPWASVKIRVQGSAGYSTEIYMSGIPEGIIGTGGNSVSGLEPSFTFSNALTAYLNVLIASTCSFRVRQLVNPLSVIQAVSQPAQANGNIAIQVKDLLVFGAPPNFGPVKQSIVIKGCRRGNENLPGLSGIYLADGLSPALQSGAAAPWIYYLQNTQRITPSNITIKGGASGLVWFYDTYFLLNPRGATHRKRGASALAPRGRSKNRV